MATKVGIVILGDEVLKGEIREANIAYMIPLLADWGAETSLCAILPDDIPLVVRHLRWYLEEVDLLLLTGGIGPTPDDITRDAVPEVAGVPLVVNPEAKAALESRPYKGANPSFRLLMAQVPQGATLIPNPLSPAPGFFIARMAVLPGVARRPVRPDGGVRGAVCEIPPGNRVRGPPTGGGARRRCVTFSGPRFSCSVAPCCLPRPTGSESRERGGGHGERATPGAGRRFRAAASAGPTTASRSR